MKKTNIAIITCYHDPDYVRARSLRAAFSLVPHTSLCIIKNRHSDLRRYTEVLWQLVKTRLTQHPDAYLLTFRGQEILPIVRLITIGKPLWFDEFVIPKAYATKEAYRRTPTRLLKQFILRLNDPLYALCLKHVSCIIADTIAHAETSAKLYGINLRSYLAVPVGTDETVFHPATTKPRSNFQLFYYSTGMQPLHGIGYVLEAALLLRDEPGITFVLVGGKSAMARAVQAAIDKGAHIEYREWVPFKELPTMMRASAINIGGPFGGTYQAEHVITGKTYQSLACGVPTLVGANRETERYGTDKQNMLIVPQANAAAIAEAIRWAAYHPAELRSIGEKGRKLYERLFSTKATANIVAPLVENLRHEG